VGDAHDHAALEKFIADLPEFDHLVSMIGDTMAGGFLQTPLDTMRHVLHSKFWTNLLIARFSAPLVRDGGSMTFTSGSGVRAQEAAASYVANQALGHRRQDTLLFPDQSPGASRDAGRSRIGLHLPNGQYVHDGPSLADRRRHDAAEIAPVASYG
jgi:hypothetical protein